MTTTIWLIIATVLMFIVSGIYLLYKSAKKFNLSKQQLEKINQRNREQDKKDKE
ncbi:DUF2897 family protein [Thalassotalea sp. ND16A]|uniref:DUF2897 family protein n=1 Tax=Thalassotalea sp. ND16A TaxID=1535422 RepID=UPI00051D2E40|nr:DUF2897 family protein [Thalassotalea sp. ND16A]KGK00925.1 hypothetical protein ND16A_3127 [Thalassotalea sp. ND16A]